MANSTSQYWSKNGVHYNGLRDCCDVHRVQSRRPRPSDHKKPMLVGLFKMYLIGLSILNVKSTEKKKDRMAEQQSVRSTKTEDKADHDKVPHV